MEFMMMRVREDGMDRRSGEFFTIELRRELSVALNGAG